MPSDRLAPSLLLPSCVVKIYAVQFAPMVAANSVLLHSLQLVLPASVVPVGWALPTS